MLKLFPFYRQRLAFAHEIHIILNVYYGAYFSNWTGFFGIYERQFLWKFIQRKWKMRCGCCCVLWHFYTRNTILFHRLGYLFMGWRFAVYDSPLAIFTLPPFLSVFVHLRFAIAIGRFMCSLNWKCSTMDGSKQQCHHSKLTKEPSLQLAKLSSSYSYLCANKQTGEKRRKSTRSGVWVFHVKFFIGMSEKCTCFNDFGIFVWRLLNRCVHSVCCQKFNCTNALFHLLNKGNICTVSCIYSTCQVVCFLPVELLCVTS